jgi:hypothetical protein
VRGDGAEQGAGPLLDKEASRQSLGRAQRTKAKRRQRNGITRPCHRAEGCALQARPAANEAAKESHVRRAVAPKPCCRLFDRSLHNCRRPIVKRVCELGLRLNELEAISLQRQRPQKWRRSRHRMHRRADVVLETGQGEFSRSRASADGSLRLEDRHFPAGLSKGDRRREAVWPRADHDGIRLRHVASDL